MEKEVIARRPIQLDTLPEPVKIGAGVDVAKVIRASTKVTPLTPNLIGEYDEYLKSMDVEYSVGQGRTLVAVYEGQDIEFTSKKWDEIVMSKGTVLGHITSKKPAMIGADLIAHALKMVADGTVTTKIYEDMAERMPLNWNFVDSLPEAASNDGAVGFLALVNVHPYLRRLGLSAMLMKDALRRFLDEDGLNYAFAFARCPGFPRSGCKDLQEYATRVDSSGLNPDYGIRIHQLVGQKIVCGVPKGAIDMESANNSVLVASDLMELRVKGMI